MNRTFVSYEQIIKLILLPRPTTPQNAIKKYLELKHFDRCHYLDFHVKIGKDKKYQVSSKPCEACLYTRPTIFTIYEPRDQEINIIYIVQERRETDLDALNL